ncbi:P-loop containing nucleoside triphosphate hydrolase protein [Xylaria cf. heliscus]|nr:P-loop containing nucleoside triphosphate hydrolase protein [Xylaria cf. heliscus]
MANRSDLIIPYDGGELQTRDYRDLFDVIDTLRSRGISYYVDLPEIIVCGDQSSGKSSVLEAILGLSFPGKKNLCTWFATELILRRSPVVNVDIYIIPSHDRSEHEKRNWRHFIVEAAKGAMGLNFGDTVFSTDIFRVEISGPTQPYLTMLEDDAKLVEALVLSYMKKLRSIVLAVVSAKSDFALQQVTRHARALDPDGVRTLGFITKLDTLDAGSDSENFYVELAKNKDVKFPFGRETSTFERDEAETEFFSTGVWKTLLSVFKNVETGIYECEERLLKLGVARGNIIEQRRYLFRISAASTSVMKASIDGNYTDPFFADTDTLNQYPKRLRAVIQNTLLDFAEHMRINGHARIILEHELVAIADFRCITRSKYIDEVKRVMKEARGRELPGSYNPLIVSELFSKQCKPWGTLVYDLGNRLFQSAQVTISAILDHVADEETAAGIAGLVVLPSMETVQKALKAKIDEILQPHVFGHPITYNHYLTENVQKAQYARKRRDMEKKLLTFFEANIWNINGPINASIKPLLDSLMSNMEPDMDKYSCSMAVDMMEAYYKVALKTVIDEVSVLAIEECLIQKLPQLLSPEIICNLTDEEVHLVAAESEISVAERQCLDEKLMVLQSGLAQLGKFKKCLTPITLENVS